MSEHDLQATFERRKAGIECPMCPDSGETDVVATLPSGKVHLQNDSDYRGYCILIFHKHAVELHEISEGERKQWIEDIARIGEAVSKVCNPKKLNISMLGNMVPHLHCHVMPRTFEDPEWGGPPAFRAFADRRTLSENDYNTLKSELQALLS